MFGKVREPHVEAVSTLVRCALPLIMGMSPETIHRRITGNPRLTVDLTRALQMPTVPTLTLVKQVWLAPEDGAATAPFAECRHLARALLPEEQPATGVTRISLYRLDSMLTIATAYRKLAQLGPGATFLELAQTLVQRRHTLTIPQILQIKRLREAFARRETGSEDPGLCASSANYFLIADEHGMPQPVYLFNEDQTEWCLAHRVQGLADPHEHEPGAIFAINDAPLVPPRHEWERLTART